MLTKSVLSPHKDVRILMNVFSMFNIFFVYFVDIILIGTITLLLGAKPKQCEGECTFLFKEKIS